MSSEENLFTRLKRYSQNIEKVSTENFVTELFAFVLEEHKPVRKQFLKLIFSKKNDGQRLVNKFVDVGILTQHPFPGGKIDIFLKGSKANLYVEIKVDSSEGFEQEGKKSQIAKYLSVLKGKTDYLSYVTKTGSPEPDYRKNPKNNEIFCGHLHWEDICEIIKKYNQQKNSEVLKLFLQFMEENNMGKTEGFTKTELRESKSVFSFLIKSKRLIEMVKEEIEPLLVEYFGKKIGSKDISCKFERKWIGWWYQPKRWRKANFGIMLIICDDGKTCKFDFVLDVWKKQLSRLLLNDNIINEKIKYLKGKNWKPYDNIEWWSVYKETKLKTGDLEKNKVEIVKKIKIALAELKNSRLINMINNRGEGL